ncbi:MAG: hypothetical protein JKY93_03200 [Gammaproteobacteria bacterium]|nr:hypothetical protein [Gammaproteobacteria bacterium]
MNELVTRTGRRERNGLSYIHILPFFFFPVFVKNIIPPSAEYHAKGHSRSFHSCQRSQNKMNEYRDIPPLIKRLAERDKCPTSILDYWLEHGFLPQSYVDKFYNQVSGQESIGSVRCA